MLDKRQNLEEIIWEDIYGTYTDTPLSRIEAILLAMYKHLRNIEDIISGGGEWIETAITDSFGDEILDSDGNIIFGRTKA